MRKNFADSRIRVKGRFVKKEEQVRISTRAHTQWSARSVHGGFSRMPSLPYQSPVRQDFMLESLGFAYSGGNGSAGAVPGAEAAEDSSLRA